MLFGRLFLCALLVGLGAGLTTTVVQRWQVVPIIAAAEVFEAARAPMAEAGSRERAAEAGPAHDHDTATWQPSDGAERIFWTVVANVLGATGFALLLLPVITWWDHRRGGQAASLMSGLIWGAGGWLCLFLWPALGLSPELPGEAAAALQGRQTWWLLAVSCAAAGLGLIVFGQGRWRLLGLPLLALPFIVGAPPQAGSAFVGYSAEAMAQLQALKSRFVVVTGLASAIQWLLIGALSALAVVRWLRPAVRAAGGQPIPATPLHTPVEARQPGVRVNR
jgi:cobalt transporter subunit CbtA